MKLDCRGEPGEMHHAIPDHVVGAPLKQRPVHDGPDLRPAIPDHVVGAPLKPRQSASSFARMAPIPDHVVGAPLKHAGRAAAPRAARRSPTTWSGPR